MPTAVGPNTFGEENLVFGYDLGDVNHSYRGEPATNSQDYDKSVMTQAGFDAWGCYDGNNSSPNYHYWGNAQSKTLVNIPGPDGKYVNAMLYHNFTGGFHGPTNWSGVASSLLTNGSKITVQGWVKAADAASVGKTVKPHLYYNKIGGGSYSSSTSYTLTAEWQLVSHSYTVPEGSTGAGTMYFFTSGGTNIKMYLTNTAIVGGRVHAIQWLPGGTTRSATQGLLDLTGNSTIDLTNVSFDSNAQMEFDGTNDKINLADAAHLKFSGGSFTIEQVLIVNSISSKQRTFSKGSSGWSRGWHAAIRPTQWEFELSDGVSSPGNSFLISTATTVGTNHVVWAVENGATVKLYVNGVQVGSTQTITEGTDFATTTSTVGIGAFESGGEYFNGKIPYTRLYSRTLIASEVKSNYNAIKGRFNL